jgi:hypothetical protein
LDAANPVRVAARTGSEGVLITLKEGWRGRFFEDFEVGDVCRHPLGRAVTTTDNIWSTQTNHPRSSNEMPGCGRESVSRSIAWTGDAHEASDRTTYD